MFQLLRNALIGAPGIPTQAAATNAVLTGYRPSQLAEYMEVLWATGQPATPWAPPFDWQHFVGMTLTDAERMAMARRPANPLDAPVPLAPQAEWRHLAYAHALENTKVVDIFFKVLSAYASGETLPPPTAATQRWLRVTEELFFTNPRLHSVRALTSSVRPDINSVRRNAYYRLLGMDLNHGAEDGRPYPFHKPEAANRDFPALFEELLRETWKAYMNRMNFIGPRATDNEALRLLVQRIREMLNSRRYGGSLSREEFDAVATLSWFHLTLDQDSSVVANLAAQASSPTESLKTIGTKVGTPAHSRADAYFRMAEPLSDILIDIENNTIEQVGVQQLYGAGGGYVTQMLTIITQWSIATGRDIKESFGVRGAMAPVGGPRPVAVVVPAVRSLN